MTDTQRDIGTTAAPTHAHPSDVPGHSVFVYESAGITEREGHVPLWLWLVVVSLLIWGIYYLAAYWNAPPPQP